MAPPLSKQNYSIGDQAQTDTDRGESDTGVTTSIGQIKKSPVDTPEPTLFHKVKNRKSILALAVSDSKLYAGTQGGELLVWSLETYELLFSVVAHTGSILCLSLSADKNLLLSSAGDAIVNARNPNLRCIADTNASQVWCPETLKRLYSLYSKYDVGDVFCVVHSVELQTVYLGAQNTSIQWYDLSSKDSRPKPDLTSHPSQRNHRFFDSKGPGGIITPRPPASRPLTQGGQDLEIDKNHIKQYAHYGYVYCMLLDKEAHGQGVNKETLMSGGGDGVINLWTLDRKSGRLLDKPTSLDNGDESVLALALDGTLLYSGRLEGDINVWDLDTCQLIRTVKAHTTDVLTLTVGHGHIFTGSANGFAKKFNMRYECISKWKAHDQLILASATTTYNSKAIYVTGGNDDCVAIWDVDSRAKPLQNSSKSSNEQLWASLSHFVSFPTVSSQPEYAGDCRKGASWLRNLFKRFGAVTEMLNTEDNRNPVVYARFKGKNSDSHAGGKKILFYGHYDVVPADNKDGTWKTNPFRMEGKNGYLYGRGVTDNKGPVLAALYAVADLVAGQQLSSDVVFLVEGEEECGSRGFQETVRKYKGLIGDIEWILLANSYWLDDEFPCLTYGLRGVIHTTIQVESERPDLHSGVDGSHLIHEALKDLVALLATLTDPLGRVTVPGFYDPIRPITNAESARYDTISDTLVRRNPDFGDAKSLTDSFKGRWREPSLTIHRIETSGPANSTIISRSAVAALSIRLVPDQETNSIKNSLQTALLRAFKNLNTTNALSITVKNEAEPWLGDPDNKMFHILEEAIMEVWGPMGHARRGSVPASKAPNKRSFKTPTSPTSPITSTTLSNGSDQFSQATSNFDLHEQPPPRYPGPTRQKPLYIREGGSIPAIRFLETEFNAPAAILPCGQASDSAHLDNERIRLSNLYKSREIFKKVFRELPLR